MNSPSRFSNSAILVQREQYERLLDELADIQLKIAGLFGAFNAHLDHVDGDLDYEDGGDDELAGDEADAAYVEWQTKPAPLRGLGEFNVGHEDAEDDDPAGGNVTDEPHDRDEGF
jgi:hypothetical protein